MSDLYPFENHFLELNGLQYHYLDEGRGDPVIMVHGNPSWSFYYRDLVKALRTRYRVIAPDHIGSGLSEKPGDGDYSDTLKQRVDHLEALLEHLQIRERITLALVEVMVLEAIQFEKIIVKRVEIAHGCITINYG